MSADCVPALPVKEQCEGSRSDWKAWLKRPFIDFVYFLDRSGSMR